ncbi:Homoserine dehydrogenase [Planctomycetes bacterium Poly30]|uniref:Homoserine dehydrogenase n=1 Tax=Saltatorellus ferox TaxID=2528018 RepID=A0A518EQX4_9BACT|nr:Homoserine dehydrogenase [Planctomycetes bacterium Poly30]
MSSVIVLKFGGSFLRGHADLVRAVHAIYREVREGRRVIAVTSAFYGRTDELASTLDALERETRGASGDPHAARRKRAALLGTGEIETASLLAATLERSGLPARIADVRNTGPFVESLDRGEPVDEDACEPTHMDIVALEALLAEAPVVCLPGFIAAEDNVNRDLALLGRGGSDLTAVFVADAIGAPVVLVKDVEGLYTSDPSQQVADAKGAPPRRLARVSYADAKSLDASVLQRRALAFAESRGQEIRVVGPGALVGARGTTVGAPPTSAQSPTAPRRPLRVALLGLGTVGRRVFAELSSAPHLFHVTAILVRRGSDIDRPRAARPLIVESFDDVLASGPELVVEATGGAEPAASWMAQLMERGLHVVTANKVAVARASTRLSGVARQHGVQFLASAAVGGSVPALETVARCAASSSPAERLVGITGVLNGTSNAILESLRLGCSWEAAIDEARAAGLAEADPTSDLDGSDVACKLELLARAAGWLDAPNAKLRWIRRDSLASGVPAGITCEEGRRLRLVGAVHLTEIGSIASIVLQSVAPGHPLFELSGAANAVVLEHAESPPTVLRGIGAGAWPTATSVMGDVFAVCRRLRLVEGAIPSTQQIEPEDAR